jgi:hypothetical protein
MDAAKTFPREGQPVFTGGAASISRDGHPRFPREADRQFTYKLTFLLVASFFAGLIFDPKDSGGTVLRNVGHQPNYTALHPRVLRIEEHFQYFYFWYISPFFHFDFFFFPKIHGGQMSNLPPLLPAPMALAFLDGYAYVRIARPQPTKDSVRSSRHNSEKVYFPIAQISSPTYRSIIIIIIIIIIILL